MWVGKKLSKPCSEKKSRGERLGDKELPLQKKKLFHKRATTINRQVFASERK